MRRKLLRDLFLHLPLYHWILHKFLLTLTPPFFLYINSFHVGSLFLYPLKTENQKFSDIFTVGYRKHSVAMEQVKVNQIYIRVFGIYCICIIFSFNYQWLIFQFLETLIFCCTTKRILIDILYQKLSVIHNKYSFTFNYQ